MSESRSRVGPSATMRPRFTITLRANPDYDAAVFEQALSERFTIDQKSPVSATRTLYEAHP